MTDEQHQAYYCRTHAIYQWIHLLVDFAAAAMFVVGSILFLQPGLERAGSWLFLIGSIFFAMKPTIRLLRVLHLRHLAREAEITLDTLFGLHRFP
jgi:uncharacterized membrane protein YgdD (TMEM256/DUF423 family)